MSIIRIRTDVPTRGARRARAHSACDAKCIRVAERVQDAPAGLGRSRVLYMEGHDVAQIRTQFNVLHDDEWSCRNVGRFQLQRQLAVRTHQ